LPITNSTNTSLQESISQQESNGGERRGEAKGQGGRGRRRKKCEKKKGCQVGRLWKYNASEPEAAHRADSGAKITMKTQFGKNKSHEGSRTRQGEGRERTQTLTRGSAKDGVLVTSSGVANRIHFIVFYRNRHDSSWPRGLREQEWGERIRESEREREKDGERGGVLGRDGTAGLARSR
jgi:hypothetical protein